MTRIIAVLVLIAAYTSASADVAYLPPFESRSDTTVLLPEIRSDGYQAIEVRASLPKINETNGKAAEKFGISWLIPDSGTKIEVCLNPGDATYGMSIETLYLELSVRKTTRDNASEIILSKRLTSNVGLNGQATTLAIEIQHGQQVDISVGRNNLEHIAKLTSEYASCSDASFFSVGKVKVSDLILEHEADIASEITTQWTFESLCNHFKSNHLAKHEGFWKYLDRATDDRYTRLGGRYIIALVSDGKSGYDIVYVDGAQTLAEKWKCGMKKGHLTPTIFQEHFDLTWRDSKMRVVDDETSAQLEQNAILTLNFPLLKSTLRFSKMPAQDM